MRRAPLLLVLLLAACTKHEPGATGTLQLTLTGPADALPFATADAVEVRIVDPGRRDPFVQSVPWPPGDGAPIEFLLSPDGSPWSLVVAAKSAGSVIAVGRSGPFGLASDQVVPVSVFVGMVNAFGTASVGLAAGRWGHTALALPDGRLAVVGGTSSDDPAAAPAAPTAELLDPLGRDPSGTRPGFRGVDGVPPRTLHGAVLAGDKVVITGGLGEGAVPLRDLWVLAPGEAPPTLQLPADMAARAGAAVALIGTWAGAAAESDASKLLVAGGCASPPPLTGCVADAWVVGLDGAGRKVTGFDVARFGATATALPEHGDVLVAGGRDENGLASAVYLFESHTSARATGVMRPVASLLVPRERHAAVALPDGAVLLVGGLDASGTTPLASAEVYVPWLGSAGRMLSAGSLSQARYDATAVALADGSIVVVGGLDAGGTPIPTVERFVPDPAGPDATTYRGAFSPLSAGLPTARSGVAVALGPGGELFVSGGRGDAGVAAADLLVFTQCLPDEGLSCPAP